MSEIVKSAIPIHFLHSSILFAAPYSQTLQILFFTLFISCRQKLLNQACNLFEALPR